MTIVIACRRAFSPTLYRYEIIHQQHLPLGVFNLSSAANDCALHPAMVRRDKFGLVGSRAVLPTHAGGRVFLRRLVEQSDRPGTPVANPRCVIGHCSRLNPRTRLRLAGAGDSKCELEAEHGRATGSLYLFLTNHFGWSPVFHLGQ